MKNTGGAGTTVNTLNSAPGVRAWESRVLLLGVSATILSRASYSSKTKASDDASKNTCQRLQATSTITKITAQTFALMMAQIVTGQEYDHCMEQVIKKLDPVKMIMDMGEGN